MKMKVKELVALLQAMPQDADLCIFGSDDGEYDYAVRAKVWQNADGTVTVKGVADDEA